MTIAKRVRDCRYAKGWGPDELASRASISRTALYQIECGKTETPRAGTLRRIAEALGVSIESLLGNEELRSVEPSRQALAEPATSASWPSEEESRLGAYNVGVRPATREHELQRMLHEVLQSPLGESLARIVEDTYRLHTTIRHHVS